MIGYRFKSIYLARRKAGLFQAEMTLAGVARLTTVGGRSAPKISEALPLAPAVRSKRQRRSAELTQEELRSTPTYFERRYPERKENATKSKF
jgi:hypothetical protein